MVEAGHGRSSEEPGSPQGRAASPSHFWVFEWSGPRGDGAESSVAEADGPEERSEEEDKSMCEQELSNMLSQALADNSRLEQSEVCSMLEEALLVFTEPLLTPLSSTPTSPVTGTASWHPSIRPDSPLQVHSDISEMEHSLIAPTDSVSASSRQRSRELDATELEMTGTSDRTASTSVDALFEGGMSRLALRGTTLLDIEQLVALSQSSGRSRLSPNEAQSLPRVRFEAPEMQCCSICMESFQHGMLLIGLACRHVFHIDCLTEWLQRSAQCPNCRRPIEPAEEEEEEPLSPL